MDTQFFNRMFGVEGKVIILTGGGGILCGEMARTLASVGAIVVPLDIRAEAAQAVADDVIAAGGQALPIHADVLDKPSLERAAETVLARYGRIDALINGAGGNKPGAVTGPDLSFFDLPQDAFQDVFNLNFIGTVFAAQVFGRAMAARGEGNIINIASAAAFLPLTKVPAYSTAKAAVKNFTAWLAVHMCQNYTNRIRVNAIAPGFFITNQNRALLTNVNTGELTPRGQLVLEGTPAGRFGNPPELLSTVFWLLSPASSYVTGATVSVDGGFTAYSGV
jgi:NAD(P)-dependent dehydrogenase (short-subunit alcohol dehydrogenase family)